MVGVQLAILVTVVVFPNAPQKGACCWQASAKRSRVSRILGSRNGRETQCRHFWTCIWSSRLKSVNRHSDQKKSRSRNAELSSLLDLRLVFASQKCRTVVTFGLAFGLRVSTVSTVTGIGGVLVAKRRIVVTFGLAFGPRVSAV